MGFFLLSRSTSTPCSDVSVRSRYAHLSGVFVEGWLQGSEGEICGGIGDPAANDSSPVSLCQTLSYSAGVGNMAFCITMIPVRMCFSIRFAVSQWAPDRPRKVYHAIHSQTLQVLQSLTIPAILMTVALPFRLYVVALTAPAVGCALQVYTTFVTRNRCYRGTNNALLL